MSFSSASTPLTACRICQRQSDHSAAVASGNSARHGSSALGSTILRAAFSLTAGALRAELRPPIRLALFRQRVDRIEVLVLARQRVGIVQLDARAVVLGPVRDALHAVVF